MIDLTSRIRSHLSLLDDGLRVVRSLDDDTYRAGSPAACGSTIGRHLRHVLDFYDAFLRAVEPDDWPVRLDYTVRRRDVPEEADRAAGVERVETIRARLGSLRAVSPDATMIVRAEVGGGEGDEPVWSGSTVGRELAALESHTIHHFAVMAVLLRVLGVAVPDTFGVATSTLKHWEARGGARSAAGSR